MYESHFGLSAPPFQLNPDPAFYFESRGHGSALAYLRFGVYQGEGFIVVTGDIGAGKTTLVRTLLEQLDPTEVVAAQVVSTQLESDDLLRAILVAFGLSADGTSKAHLIASLEAFLTAVAAAGKRALLVIDEAQNLGPRAVEELRMLSNFQLGTHGLLQSFLIGQPELRNLLRSPAMEQLRQRVIASCHLGPLDEAETRAYVLHRLRKVGWVDSPEIEEEAFHQIHVGSGGVPRLINRLCNRLLLAAYLKGEKRISSELVRETNNELSSEIGAAPSAPGVPVPAAKGDGLQATDANLAQGFVCVLSSRDDLARGSDLIRNVKDLTGSVQLPVLVQLGQSLALTKSTIQRSPLPPGTVEVEVDVDRTSSLSTLRDSIDKFSGVVDRARPKAIVVVGLDDAILGCALVANKRGIPIMRLKNKMEAVSPNSAVLQSLCMDPTTWVPLAASGGGERSEIAVAAQWVAKALTQEPAPDSPITQRLKA